MRHSLDQANDLIFRLYEAAQDRSLLPSFMIALTKQFKGHIGGLRIHDSGHSALTSHYVESVGILVPEWQAFDAACGDRNFWRTKGFQDMRANGVGHDGTIAPRRDLIRTDFYQFLKTIDIDYGMGICLWSGPQNQTAVLSLNRPRASGAFSSGDMAFAKRLLPHFRSAYGIMRRLSWRTSTSASLATAIDRLHIGVILVNCAGRSVYCNEVGEYLVGLRAGVTLTAARTVRCADASAQRRLDETVRNAARGLLDAPARIYIRDLKGMLRQVLVVTMVRGDFLLRGGGDAPCAAIFIHTPSNLPKNSESILRDAWRLTPAEARLAALLADGNEVCRCAEMLGVSVTTVRTQLRSLFAKTDTHRQSELMSDLEFVLRAG